MAVIRRIFAFQAKGNIPEAVRATADLHDTVLLGPLLADRYLGRYHRSTTAELSGWLDSYHDQPDAPAIHALLAAKLGNTGSPPVAPDVALLSRSVQPEALPLEADDSGNDLQRPVPLGHFVVDRAQRGNGAEALRLINAQRGIKRAYAARLRAEVAQVLFTRNDDAGALRIAEDSIRDTAPAEQNSLTYYIGGLAAWRLNRIEQARHLFEGGAQAALSSSRLRAASAFWASRAARRQHDAVATMQWLRTAAEERTTLHGILARRTLRMDIGIIPGGELLTDADVDAVAHTPQGLRAFALLQVGQPDRAEAELRALWPDIQANALFGRSVLLVASATGLTDFAAQLAGLLPGAERHRFDELRFPIPRLRPTGGFRVDPTLVYALTRTESNFDSSAISPSGARGLMQIMPATAQYIAADLPAPEDRLHEPAFNLEIGQRYLAFLAGLDGIRGDLIRLLASYNAGPGNFQRWGAEIRDNDDPLLFIEAIPVVETRNFVADVLTSSWVYAARLHRPAPTLDSLASGEFPRFTPLPRESKLAGIPLRLN